MTHRSSLWAMVLLAVLSATTAAKAETALLLPVRGDDALEALRERGREALMAALQAQGIQLVTREQAVARLPTREGRDCVSVECAPALLRPAGADFAVAMALWVAGGAAPTRSVFITLVDAQGTRYPGSAVMQGDAVDTAVGAALNDARGLQLLGPGPWLRVTGTPEGAAVYLDGSAAGSLPYRAAVSPGLHTLEVRADGYAPFLQSVQVPPNGARQLEVEVALGTRGAAEGPGEGAASPDDALGEALGEAVHGDTRRVRPVLGPVLLGAAGLGLLTTSIVLAAVDGCQVESAGRCVEGTRPNTGALIAYGAVGVAAITGAVLWHLLGGRDEPADARVGLSPTGLLLEQRF